MRAYLDVTGHFIVNFKLQSVMLSCLHFHGPHNADIILCYFEDIVTSFQITGKVYRCITDNASNMKKGFRLLGFMDENDDNSNDEVDEEDSDETNDIVPTELPIPLMVPCHHSCFSHTLQLDGLKNASQIWRVLAKTSMLVSHVSHSAKASDLIENDIRLQMSNTTWWNSQLIMIRSLLRVSASTMPSLD